MESSGFRVKAEEKSQPNRTSSRLHQVRSRRMKHASYQHASQSSKKPEMAPRWMPPRAVQWNWDSLCAMNSPAASFLSRTQVIVDHRVGASPSVGLCSDQPLIRGAHRWKISLRAAGYVLIGLIPPKNKTFFAEADGYDGHGHSHGILAERSKLVDPKKKFSSVCLSYGDNKYQTYEFELNLDTMKFLWRVAAIDGLPTRSGTWNDVSKESGLSEINRYEYSDGVHPCVFMNLNRNSTGLAYDLEKSVIWLESGLRPMVTATALNVLRAKSGKSVNQSPMS